MILSASLKNLSHNVTQTLTHQNNEPAHPTDATLSRDTAVTKPMAPQQPPAPQLITVALRSHQHKSKQPK